jgi:hypothetical protein
MSSDDEARRLWDEHKSAPFPDRLRGMELEGVEMVMLDADIAGCIGTWLGRERQLNEGPPRAARPLDERRRSVLQECLVDLDRVLPLLLDGERAYYRAPPSPRTARPGLNGPPPVTAPEQACAFGGRAFRSFR